MKNQPPGVLELIGNTPLIEITRFDTGPCRLFAKMESQNPGGSIKDRIARQMIDVAEKEGKLKPGGTIVEATAGNTGLGLTLLGALKGYKVILVVPDKMSREKIFHCKAMGADVRVARSDVVRGHPEYYQDVAARIAEETGGFFVNQFANPANVAAHFDYTGPEIFTQMEQDVDAVVCGVGSGGTLTGIGNYMKKVSPKTEMVLADPVGSILAPMINEGKTITPGSWLVEGIGEDFIPDILDLSLVKKAYAVSDEESLATARELLLQEGILAGPSSGTLAAAALRYCREQTEPKRVVTIICDRGDKYLSKTFSSFWMTEQGFTERTPTGTVEDLVVRRHDTGDTVTVRKSDTIRTAYKRMRFADVSQLPVLDESGNLLGIIDEKTLLNKMTQEERERDVSLEDSVTSVMRPASPVLQKSTLIEDAAPLLQKGSAVMVADGDKFVGVVTRIDMLNYFYLKGQAA
jgi:cystathionine beta-synthase